MYKNTKKNINKLLFTSLLTVGILQANSLGFDAIGLNVGYAYMPYTHSENKPDALFSKDFLNLELYTVLKNTFDDNRYKPTINYIYNVNNQFNNHSLLLGINRYFYLEEKKIYLGVLLGYGQLQWDKETISNTTKNDLEAGSIVGGLQGGIELLINKHLSFNINSKLLLHSYDMSIEDTPTYKAEYLHPYTASLSLGIKYSFNTNSTRQRVLTNNEISSQKSQINVIKEPVIVKEIVQIVEPKKVIQLSVVLDGDGDGVNDLNDNCINTPKGFAVDSDGCVKLFTLNIKFAYKSNQIPFKYDKDIRKLVKFLKNRPQYHAIINAYTDNIGSQEYNLILSEARAHAVYIKLKYYGISEHSLSYSGLGESNPVATNVSEEGRKKNRRVEVILVKGNLND